MIEKLLENEAVIGVIALAIAYAFKILRDLVVAKVKNEKVQGILIRLSHAVETEVTRVANTDVKQAKRDGNWDGVAKAKAKAAVVTGVEEVLGVKTLNEIHKVLGVHPSALIGKGIEAAVPRINKAIAGSEAMKAALGK